MTDGPCEFCGSPTKLVDTDYYDRADATEPVKTPCCLAQKKNMAYLRSRFDPRDQDAPDLDDVSNL